MSSFFIIFLVCPYFRAQKPSPVGRSILSLHSPHTRCFHCCAPTSFCKRCNVNERPSAGCRMSNDSIVLPKYVCICVGVWMCGYAYMLAYVCESQVCVTGVRSRCILHLACDKNDNNYNHNNYRRDKGQTVSISIKAI